MWWDAQGQEATVYIGGGKRDARESVPGRASVLRPQGKRGAAALQGVAWGSGKTSAQL